MNSNRINWLDISKGIAILLVITAHCDIPNTAKNVIYFFHMPLFFILAGLTLNFNTLTKLTTIIKKKAKRLLLPYLGFSLLLLAFKFLKHLLLKDSFSLLLGLISIFIPISGWSNSSVYGLWFLPTLFLAQLIIYSIAYCKKKIFKIVLTLLFFLIWLFAYQINVVSIIVILPIAIGFILAGYYFKNFIFTEKSKFLQIIICIFSSILCIILGQLNLRYIGGTPDISSMTLGCIPIYIISALSGSLVIIFLSQIISKSKILSYFGIYSLQYYGYHYIALSIALYVSHYSLIQIFFTLSLSALMLHSYKFIICFCKSKIFKKTLKK